MFRPRLSRAVTLTLATLLGAAVGAVLLSGSDQPVTAHVFARWQQLATPPLSPRTDALGVHVGHRVLVLGGRQGSVLRDGATYDLRTGMWRHLRMPVAVTDRDHAVAAAGVAVLRHARPGRPATWWRYDPRIDVWSRMRHLPARLSVAVGARLGGVRPLRQSRRRLQRPARPVDAAAGRPTPARAPWPQGDREPAPAP